LEFIAIIMAHGKQKKAQKDGQYRKETKEERRLRLERQQQAREVRMELLVRIGKVRMILTTTRFCF
jgi:hypothetical protein